jgi:uncharacterized protein YpbB
MKGGYASFLILFCLHHFNGERSLSAIYHLFSGKKSSQTLQDSKWFQLEQFFGVWKEVTLNDVESIAQQLLENGLISPVNERSYILTEAGKKQLDEQLHQIFFPVHLNGWRYHATEKTFWYRLSLLVQTLSNVLHRTRFEPIHRHEETLMWVKRYLLSQRRTVRELAQTLYEEIYDILSSVSEEEATVFTLRLTSFERIGWTNEQIASYLQKDPVYVQFQFQNVLHYMMATAESKRPSVLYELMHDLSLPIPLTFSTQKTYEWLLRGKSIEEIAKLRRLKRSTIEDHVVEIAANIPHFSIKPFINEKRAAKIMETVRKLRTRKLKTIRDAIDDDVSYFEIRLVLAKEGEMW